MEFVAGHHPDLPLWAAGFSFGSWVALTTGADDPRVELLLAVSPPVTTYDFSALRDCPLPKFFIHGERDDVCSVRALWLFYAGLAEPKELVVIDGADHLYEGKVGEVGDAIDDLLRDYTPPGRKPPATTGEQHG
jgi:alpha/beta superfamily hydrolase